jgi:acetyl esterase/lipase
MAYSRTTPALACAVATFFGLALFAGAQETALRKPPAERAPAPAEVRQYAEKVRPFLTRHCLDCHGPEDPDGDLRLDNLSQDFSDEVSRKHWQHVLRRVKAGEMPPKGRPRPTEMEVRGLADWIGAKAEAANKPLVVDVWPGKVPGDDAATIGEEKFIDIKSAPNVKWLTNVTKPTLTIYRPAKDKDTGAAVLICPGGGYHNLAWDLEGEEVADWLNSLGVTGIILKYRCPRRPGDVKGEPAPGPLKDAQRAVSLVRSRAKEWGIDPRRIGMIGFSAGGHLVGSTATNFGKRSYEPIDGADKVSCRPDFGIMAYSGYFKRKDKDELSPTVGTPADTPPLFFVHASDDPVSEVEHSVAFYLALKRAKIDAELHVYAAGGHGFGVRTKDGPCSGWTQTCADWLRHRGFLKPESKP